MFLPLLFLLPVLSSALSLERPIDKRCAGAAVLAPPVTWTSLRPTQTWAAQDDSKSACPVTYTTVLPTLGPGPEPGSPSGLHPHTYSVTYDCDGTSYSPCQLPGSKDICPPGFVKTATVCDTCGSSPVTYTLTLLEPTPTAVPHATDKKGPDSTNVPPSPGSDHSADHPGDHSDGGGGVKPAIPIPPQPESGPDSNSTEHIETPSSPSSKGSAGDRISGTSSTEASGPEATDQGSTEHVEVSAGASLRMFQWLGEALAVGLVLAAVNFPL
ncbi:DASH complex subunit dad3 [Verticillium dahliae VDG1]|nr:DASH complex subunit dad3 [Verticillium dahliae VDG1]